MSLPRLLPVCALAGLALTALAQELDPSLLRPGPPPAVAPPAPVTLRFLGRVDGSDRIHVDRHGAHWEHLHYGQPVGAVLFGGATWEPARSGFLPNSGAQPFLDPAVDFASAELVRRHGRDTVALERSSDSITIHLCDSPPGDALYEFEVRFRRHDPRYELTVLAVIDGSDELHISAAGARWIHRQWDWPQGPVILNGRLAPASR